MSFKAFFAAVDYSREPTIPAWERLVVMQIMAGCGRDGDSDRATTGQRYLEAAQASLQQEFPFVTVDHVRSALDRFAMRTGQEWVDLDERDDVVATGPAFRRVRLTRELVDAVFARDEFTCQHCGSANELTIDHIVPVSRGGTNVNENLQTLCRSCNSRKGAR